jgi:hypothetical protein
VCAVGRGPDVEGVAAALTGGAPGGMLPGVNPRTDYGIGVAIGSLAYGGLAGAIIGSAAGVVWGVLAAAVVAACVVVYGVRRA